LFWAITDCDTTPSGPRDVVEAGVTGREVGFVVVAFAIAAFGAEPFADGAALQPATARATINPRPTKAT
jgi:hypothetical protein